MMLNITKILSSKKIKLKGLHGITRQNAIIRNNKINKKIANYKIKKAQEVILNTELKKAHKALGTHSTKKVLDALKKVTKK